MCNVRGGVGVAVSAWVVGLIIIFVGSLGMVVTLGSGMIIGWEMFR